MTTSSYYASPLSKAEKARAAALAAKAMNDPSDAQRRGKPSKKKYPFHRLAAIFPLLNGAEFDALVDDIKAHGQREPIVLYQEQVLDGRNRVRACKAAGIVPCYETFTGDDAAATAYVVSANFHRRHLDTAGKRKVIATLLKANPEKSDRAIGRMIKADNKTVASVRAEQEGREEIPHVESRVDSKGRQQPARKAKPARAISPGTSNGSLQSKKRKKADAALEAKNARNIFFLNCDTARELAATYDGPVDADIVRNCEAVVQAWTKLLGRLKKELRPQCGL
jgi:ParB-like chromosome segregation protein Spo0J